MQIVRPVVRTVGSLHGTVRDINRLREVARILIRHGFGLLVKNVDIPGLPHIEADAFDTTPDRAVAAIQELGPTFIKLGQVLSTRPDVIPVAYVEAFQQLQDDVGPLPVDLISGQLARELGQTFIDRVAWFDESALATASIAQVHRARLDDDSEVVFKIQRPGIRKVVDADLSILRLLAGRVYSEFPEATFMDIRGILEEFDRSIRAELDFHAEAQATRRFRENFANDARVRIPRVYGALSTAAVLCLEFLEGVKIREAAAAGYDMTEVGTNYLDVAYRMLFDHGYFHGDLHPGNVLVLPGGVVGLLDFGMTGSLTREVKDNLVALLFAVERGDFRTCTRVFFDIAIKEGRVDYQAFERDVIDVMQRNWVGVDFASMQVGRFLTDITRGAMRHRVRAPPNYTMFFKALITTEGLVKALIPEMDPLAAARPYVQRLVSERFSERRFKEDFFYHAVTLSSLARRLPITLSQVMDDLDRQQLRLHLHHRNDPKEAMARDRRQNRLILAMMAVTAALCGSVTLYSDVYPLLGLPVLSWIFYLTALPLFLLSLWMTLRNRG